MLYKVCTAGHVSDPASETPLSDGLCVSNDLVHGACAGVAVSV